MSEPVLRVERDAGVATLTMNRPEARNALNRDLRVALTEAFESFAADDAIGVVILTGNGAAFCAGLDLKEMAEVGPDSAIGGRRASGHTLVETMESFDRPIIAAVNGVAVTGGFELALCADVLIGSTEARFADTHARVGILPGWGLSQKLPRMIGPVRARMVSFTGNYVAAEEAERWGLLARVVPPEDLLPTCRALAQDMLSCDPETLRGYKRVIADGYAGTYADGRRMESERSIAHAKSVTADQIAERRLAVTARGRDQTGSGRS